MDSADWHSLFYALLFQSLSLYLMTQTRDLLVSLLSAIGIVCRIAAGNRESATKALVRDIFHRALEHFYTIAAKASRKSGREREGMCMKI